MGYIEPPTRADEEFVDAKDWNADIKDNLDYLKAEADKMLACIQSQSEEVVFQNEAKFLMVTVKIVATGGSGNIWALCNAFTPPTTLVAMAKVQDVDADRDVASFSFMVPPDYYFTITGSGYADVSEITLWEFH